MKGTTSARLEAAAREHGGREVGVALDYSRPGKPIRQRLCRKGFDSRVRQGCLNALTHFGCSSLADARCTIEAWRVEYDTVRPHGAIGDVPPAEHARSLAAACCSQ
jgi:putative transposase